MAPRHLADRQLTDPGSCVVERDSLWPRALGKSSIKIPQIASMGQGSFVEQLPLGWLKTTWMHWSDFMEPFLFSPTTWRSSVTAKTSRPSWKSFESIQCFSPTFQALAQGASRSYYFFIVLHLLPFRLTWASIKFAILIASCVELEQPQPVELWENIFVDAYPTFYRFNELRDLSLDEIFQLYKL